MTVRLVVQDKNGLADAAQVNCALRQLQKQIDEVERTAGSSSAPPVNIQDLARQVAQFINVGSSPSGSIGSLTFGVPPVATGTSLTEGSSLSPARADHVHTIGKYGAKFSVLFQATSTSTPVDLTSASEDFDTDNMHEGVTNPSRLTVVTPGYYLVGGDAIWDANATGQRFSQIGVNGGIVVWTEINAAAGGLNTAYTLVGIKNLVAGDYVQHRVSQNSGGNLNVSGAVWAWRLA